MSSPRIRILGLVILAGLPLAGCESMKGTADAKASADKSSRLSAAIADAARDAQGSGRTRESLLFQEKLYHDDPNNQEKILQYAKALRYAGRTDDAILVIRTPAKGARATEPMMTEAAMILISAGEYDEALGFAQRAVEKNPKSVDAHHALALALSGLGKYEDAQLQFQETIQMWPDGRDQTAIINNWAMSLAAQGKVAEARTAMSMATGEALRSQTYQNNRALLEALKDRTPVKAEKLEPVIPKPVLVHEDVAEPKTEAVVAQPAQQEDRSVMPGTARVVSRSQDTGLSRNKRQTSAASKVRTSTPDPDPRTPTPAALKAVSNGGKMVPIVEE